jgi:hypothetical protein
VRESQGLSIGQGHRYIAIVCGKVRQWEQVGIRRAVGGLGGPKTPRNVALSAVMHGCIDVLSFTDRPMVLVHHPFARRALPLGLFPFCEERHFSREGGELVTISPTMTVGEFFGLPLKWPFFDAD